MVRKIGPVQAGDGHHVDALLAGAGQLTRGVEAAAVAVEQERHHHAGVVGREAALFRVGLQDGREVEGLAHRVPDEVRQVSWRDELKHGGRQQPALIDVPCAKHFGHRPK